MWRRRVVHIICFVLAVENDQRYQTTQEQIESCKGIFDKKILSAITVCLFIVNVRFLIVLYVKYRNFNNNSRNDVCTFNLFCFKQVILRIDQ